MAEIINILSDANAKQLLGSITNRPLVDPTAFSTLKEYRFIAKLLTVVRFLYYLCIITMKVSSYYYIFFIDKDSFILTMSWEVIFFLAQPHLYYFYFFLIFTYYYYINS